MMRDERDPFQSMNPFGTFLLMLEFYHFVSHMMILCRVRLLPRKDLVRIRYYFLIDALTVLSVYYYTGVYWWQTIMTIVQFIQHMYYFIFWERTERAKTVSKNFCLSFSSLHNAMKSLHNVLCILHIIMYNTYSDIPELFVYFMNIFTGFLV